MADVVPISTDPMDGTWVSLAHEIAADILPLPDILRNHGVSAREWERLQANERFQQLLQSKIVEWNSAANTVERLKAKYGASLELSAGKLHALLNDDAVSPKDRLEIAKFMAGFVSGGRGTGAPGEVGGTGGFNLTIQISGRQPLVINGQAEKAPDAKVIEVEE